MKYRTLPRYYLPLAICFLCFAILLIPPATQAQNGDQISVTNRWVIKRMHTMQAARTAVKILAEMVAGKARFDYRRARLARRDLIALTHSIPSVFRRARLEPASRARPSIWANWDDFKTRAKGANTAAKALNANRLTALRSTLPQVIHACLNCHQTYREPR